MLNSILIAWLKFPPWTEVYFDRSSKPASLNFLNRIFFSKLSSTLNVPRLRLPRSTFHVFFLPRLTWVWVAWRKKFEKLVLEKFSLHNFLVAARLFVYVAWEITCMSVNKSEWKKRKQKWWKEMCSDKLKPMLATLLEVLQRCGEKRSILCCLMPSFISSQPRSAF